MNNESPRDAIINNAALLMSLKGYNAMGICELLTLSKISKGSFYHYFDSKEMLLTEVLNLYFDRHIEAMNNVMKTNLPADERILAYFNLWTKSSEQTVFYQTSLMVQLSTEMSGVSSENADIYHCRILSIVSKLAVTLNQGKQEGSVVSLIDSMQAARNILNMWLGASLLAKVSLRGNELDSTLKITKALIYSQFY
ncbi:TPA: TetR/AcrR family transcriptional regulator [Enterobacter hormaechei subsp. steigerwaltii]|nr:TetR/AcrR family transcriptional regulator [Enterobacter hormaechei subsp. steigerwaltii]